jgi:hypothetical protein
MTDAPPDTRLCSRCHQADRLPHQRWCRACLTAYKRDRRARLRGEVTGADVPTPGQAEEAVTPAPPVVERPWVLCGLCGYADWFEHEPGVWRCRLDGRTPDVHHRPEG